MPGSTKAKHVVLMPFMVGTWARAIVAGAATINEPPASPEFNSLLKKALSARGKSSRKKSRQNDTSSDDSSYRRRVIAPQIHYVQLPTTAVPDSDPATSNYPNAISNQLRRRNSLPISTPTKTRTVGATSALIAASSIGQFSASEYNESGLLVFLTWCAEKYGDAEFTAAYAPLNEHKMGIDLLAEPDITADILVQKCGVQYGTAKRIFKAIHVWLQSLES